MNGDDDTKPRILGDLVHAAVLGPFLRPWRSTDQKWTSPAGRDDDAAHERLKEEVLRSVERLAAALDHLDRHHEEEELARALMSGGWTWSKPIDEFKDLKSTEREEVVKRLRRRGSCAADALSHACRERGWVEVRSEVVVNPGAVIENRADLVVRRANAATPWALIDLKVRWGAGDPPFKQTLLGLRQVSGYLDQWTRVAPRAAGTQEAWVLYISDDGPSWYLAT